jgi:phosphatidylinositol-3-phosphatase
MSQLPNTCGAAACGVTFVLQSQTVCIMAKRNDKPVGIKNNPRWHGRAYAIFTLLGALAACSGGTEGSPASQGAPTVVAPGITAQPQNTTVSVGQTASFTVTATGTAPLAYQWRRSGSAIAGATAATYTTAATSAADSGAAFSVVVTNPAGTVTSGNAILTVSAASTSSLSITTSTLPGGVVQSAYTATLQATGGKTPYAWTVVSGQLPAGLVLSATTGTISGTPITVENSSFTVSVHDAAGASATLAASIAISATSAGAPFGHVVIVVEENANYASVVGDTAAMPYLNSLIDSYGLATQYYSNTHPSIGNYMMLVTGQVLTNDDGETPESFPVSANNVVRQLAANRKTWKAYAEDLPSVGYTGGDTGNYAVRHVPLAYLTDVQGSAAGKETLVPFTQFATDLASGKLPDYSFVTPNLCNDAHNCALSVADAWLKTNIAPLLTSTPFKDDGVLIVVFDESSNDDTHGGGRIAAVIISPKFSKVGYQSTTLYQHESTLRLMLEGLGITTALPGAAATAATMWEFFDTPL